MKAAILVAAAILAGCATKVTETCGTLLDGSEFCALVEVKK